jgi:hypothetical protein
LRVCRSSTCIQCVFSDKSNHSVIANVGVLAITPHEGCRANTVSLVDGYCVVYLWLHSHDLHKRFDNEELGNQDYGQNAGLLRYLTR